MLSKLWADIRSVVQFRVRRWNYGMGGWNEKDAYLSVTLEEDVWYWALICFLAWDGLTRICELLHHIPLPQFLCNWERAWDEDEPQQRMKFGDWYGDDLSSLWHCKVEYPICNWAWSHRNAKGDIHLRLSPAEALEKFGAEHPAIQWMNKELARHRAWDAETLAEVRVAVASGEMTRERALEKLEFRFDVEGEEAANLLDGKAEQ